MSTYFSRHNKYKKKKRLRFIPLQPIAAYRLKASFLVICAGLFALTGRMAWLQLYEGPLLKAQARANQTRKVLPLGSRRSIVDRRGRLIAVDETRFRLYAHPIQFQFPGDSKGHVRTPIEVAKPLATLLAIPIYDLVAALEGRKTGVKLTEGLSPDMASKVRRLGISGLDLQPYSQRVYPQDDLFANVVGFLDYDRNAQAGLELSLNKLLSRKEKTKTIRYGKDGTAIPDGIRPNAFVEDNQRLYLTLDSRLQQIAIDALKAQTAKWSAKKGVVIAMDVNNGEILALASTPTYNPNKYWEYSPSLYKEWSVEELFEPGSTFKPINLAFALQEEVINQHETIYDNGQIRVGGWSLGNWDNKPNGLIDFAKVLQVSSNVGMVKTMQKLSPQKHWDWLERLEIDQRPHTDLPGSVGGQMRSKELFVNQPIHQAVASYGQGFSITPLKLAQLHALIANGGKLVSPHITKGFKDQYSLSKNSENQLLDPTVAKTVLSWMESVVDSYGDGSVKTDNYRIGGKTGTADQTKDGLGYSSKVCSFVAVLPIESPRFVVLVAIDNPNQPGAYGSTVAMPVAKKIIDSLIAIEKIPPTEISPTLISSEKGDLKES